jgi:hypothetical protein
MVLAFNKQQTRVAFATQTRSREYTEKKSVIFREIDICINENIVTKN